MAFPLLPTSFWRLLLTAAVFLAWYSPAAAQQLTPRDTSFTTRSAYVKAKKQYPNSSIARPPVPATIRSQTNLAYCALPNGHTLQLDVFYPAAKPKRRHRYPGVLVIHGGGWRSGDRSQHVPLAQQLAARGYVAVTAEYRLSTEATYPAAVQDLKAAIRWMRAHADAYGLDTARVAVWGFSAGGQLAALIGTTNGNPRFEASPCQPGYSSRVQAIVDADGILAFIHPESGEGDDSRSTSAATYWFGSPKAANPALWQEASALRYVNAHTPPILFINSAVARMHAGRDDMIHQLDSLHIYHEQHTFPDTPHPFPLFNPWFEPTVQYTIAFLDKVFHVRR